MSTMNYGSNYGSNRDTTIRVLDSSYKMLKHISIDKKVPLKHVFDNIVADFFKKFQEYAEIESQKIENRADLKRMYNFYKY